MTHESRIALLIDADNSPASKIDEILDELANYGVINIRRAYGNWKSRHLNAWEEVLHEYASQPMQQFAYTKGKNATDDSRNYGYAKLKDLYQAIGLFDVQTKDKGIYVRDKRLAQRSPAITAQSAP